MKVNQHHALITAKVVLVPYSKHHVPTYHAWMQDPALQEATASEPLTLDEEYAMQRSWREDADKLTFIICQPIDPELTRAKPDPRKPFLVGVDDSPERMIGDVNLFLFEPDENENENENDGRPGDRAVIGELELMIARKDLHRKGYGRASLLTLMGYVLFHWPTIYQEYTTGTPPVPGPPTPESLSDKPAGTTPPLRPQLKYLRVKIQQGNVGSIALFEKVGFKRTSSQPNYFGEVELRWKYDSGFIRRLKDLEWMRCGAWEAGVVPYHEESLGVDGRQAAG